MKKRIIGVAMACMLLAAAFLPKNTLAAESAQQYTAAQESGFHYVHDPMEYPGIEADIVVNPAAIYGMPFEMYSCSPETAYKPYSVFVVKKPIHAVAGMVAPWFDQPGGATRVVLSSRVKDLLEEGYLERVEYR